MLTCPNGHSNPKGRQLCAQCDAFLVPVTASTRAYQRWWFAAGCGAVVAFLISAVVAAVVVSDNRSQPTPTPVQERAAVQQWLQAGADKHLVALHSALEGAQKSLQQFDKLGVERSCQRIHDAAVVDLQADLPSPDPDLTAEVDAAIQDAHTTAHVCLSAMSGSPNNYDIEFITYLDQSLKHLDAATEIVDKARLEA